MQANNKVLGKPLPMVAFLGSLASPNVRSAFGVTPERESVE
jgi:hypothetical protein